MQPAKPIIYSLLLWAVVYDTTAETYVYIEKDGTRWITDRQLPADQFTFVEKYGRPTATRSCKGVTPAIMEQRANRYMDNVHRYAEQHQVDPYLIKAVITVESCFDRHAVSRAGARGLMQLMPQTAQQYGLFDRFHAEDNIRVGVTHLSELLQRFKDIKLSLAAYNAGIKAVEKYQGIPPYRETQGYVTKVLRYYQRYKSETSSFRQDAAHP